MVLLLKNVLFTILVPGLVAVYAPLVIAQGSSLAAFPVLLAIGVLLLILGTLIYASTVLDFAITGKGTPLPLYAPKKLVVKGLYRYTRNPMYLGVILTILGWAAIFGDGWIFLYAILVGVAVHIFVVLYEEPKLQKLFGEEYGTYRRSVRRWIPRLPGI